MKRYAIVGISNRAIWSYIEPMIKTYGQWTQIVAMLDLDPMRFDVAHKLVPNLPDVPTFAPDDFDRMIDETKPDVVMVMTQDWLHEQYTVAALKRGIDVVVEKPMTISCKQAQAVIDAEAASEGSVIVTHNYRYTPHSQMLKQLVREGRVGRVTHVDFNYYIDTRHGASYFKRWNRMRERSGGLTIHKSSHHFDLVNWITDQEPQQAFAYSKLNYYGPDGGKNPSHVDGRHCSDCPDREDCAYEMRWKPHRTGDKPLGVSDEEHLLAMNLQTYTDYRADQCIFDSQIDIEDTYTATARYDGGMMLSYSVNFSTPYEGSRLAINGTEGRLEFDAITTRGTFTAPPQQILYYPLFGGAREIIEPLPRSGGHGGGDPIMLEEIFLGPDKRKAWSSLGTARAGAMAVALGEAVWRSGKDNRPYNISELLNVPPRTIPQHA